MQCHFREPSLNELMQEPIIRAVMASDDVEEAKLRRMLDRISAAYHGSASDRRPN
jgi:hypothetical protein